MFSDGIPALQLLGTVNLLGTGGFMPTGFGSVLLGITVVIFSFMGTEIVTIAAGESDHPAKRVELRQIASFGEF